MSGALWVLPLDDPRWGRLKKAYSPADEFLPVLAELEADPRLAPQIAERFADRNYVCHQFCPSETTVAVIPHFVRAAGRVDAPHRARILEEVGYYATLLGVPLPPDCPHLCPDAEVRAAYDAAVRAAAGLFAGVLALPCSEPEAVIRGAAMAGLHGHTRLATVLFKVGIFSGQECPSCSAEFDPLAEWGRTF
jgi:hypothetical protein